MLLPSTCGKKRRLGGLWKRIPFPALEEAATASVHAVGDGAKPHRASIAILVGGTATARRWRCSPARFRRYSRLRGSNGFKFHRVGVRHPEMPAELSAFHSEAWGWRYRQVYMALLFVARASAVLAVSGGLQCHGTAASYLIENARSWHPDQAGNCNSRDARGHNWQISRFCKGDAYLDHEKRSRRF